MTRPQTAENIYAETSTALRQVMDHFTTRALRDFVRADEPDDTEKRKANGWDPRWGIAWEIIRTREEREERDAIALWEETVWSGE